MENENDPQEVLNPEEGNQDALVPESEQDTNLDGEDKRDELIKNYKIRAEKAEKENKDLKTKLKPIQPEKETPKNESKNEYSLKDIKALSDVHDDDVDKVVGWAKFNAISIAEAKKTPEMQGFLKNKEEERATALAANTGTVKRGTSKVSDEVLLEKLEKGELPEEDIEKVVKARLEKKKGA